MQLYKLTDRWCIVHLLRDEPWPEEHRRKLTELDAVLTTICDHDIGEVTAICAFHTDKTWNQTRSSLHVPRGAGSMMLKALSKADSGDMVLIDRITTIATEKAIAMLIDFRRMPWRPAARRTTESLVNAINSLTMESAYV